MKYRASIYAVLLCALAAWCFAPPAEAQIMTRNTAGSGVSVPAGDLGGTNAAPTVLGLHFGTTAQALSSTAPTSGQFLQWNGTNIVGAAASGSPGGTAGAIQYNSAGGFGGAVITGLVLGNGASAPTALSGNTLAAHNFANSINASGTLAGAQPAFTDISGTAAASQLPNPSATTIGGVESYAAVTHQWLNSISTLGVPASTQPACGDLSNAGAGCTAATMTNTVGGLVPTPPNNNYEFLRGDGNFAGGTSIVGHSLSGTNVTLLTNSPGITAWTNSEPLTLSGNTTATTPASTQSTDGDTIVFPVIQAAGNYTLALAAGTGTTLKYRTTNASCPAVPTGAGSSEIFVLHYTGSNTTWYVDACITDPPQAGVQTHYVNAVDEPGVLADTGELFGSRKFASAATLQSINIYTELAAGTCTTKPIYSLNYGSTYGTVVGTLATGCTPSSGTAIGVNACTVSTSSIPANDYTWWSVSTAASSCAMKVGLEYAYTN